MNRRRDLNPAQALLDQSIGKILKINKKQRKQKEITKSDPKDPWGGSLG
jgi:hypothetical protein